MFLLYLRTITVTPATYLEWDYYIHKQNIILLLCKEKEM